MFWLNTKRIIKTGATNFWRNGIVSLSAVSVTIITLFILAGVLFSDAIIKHTLNELKESVDVNITLLNSAEESSIIDLKTNLESLDEVGSVEYITSVQALEDYKTRHSDNPRLLAAIDELDENPLNPSLNIIAKEIGQYQNIQDYINEKYPSDQGGSIIDDVNYPKKQEAISKLSSITDSAEKFGLLITVVFILLSIIITFNTIRLTIFISKEEIRLMNLVGAEHGYISGPFVITGSMYGIVSAVIVLIALYPISYFIGPEIGNAFFEFNMFNYYVSNFGYIFMILLLSGIVIGSISSVLAIGRYLRKNK